MDEFNYKTYTESFKNAARDVMILEDLCGVIANELPEETIKLIISKMDERAEVRKQKGEY